MKFYNRITEIAELQRVKDLAYNEHSKLTVLTGRRRRIGKTSLILKSLEQERIIYLLVVKTKLIYVKLLRKK